MKKDSINELFERMEGTFDIHETPSGHKQRFLERLNAQPSTIKKRTVFWKPLSIAASIVILIGMGFTFFNTNEQETGLASVSPEMEQTQTFFTTTINKELETLKGFNAPETKALVDDALKQMEILEHEYEKLKADLSQSGNDKRVIAAMINNFQKRIELLQQVIVTIEDIKNFKTNSNEITI